MFLAVSFRKSLKKLIFSIKYIYHLSKYYIIKIIFIVFTIKKYKTKVEKMIQKKLIAQAIFIALILLVVGISTATTTGNTAFEKQKSRDSPGQDIKGLYYLRGIDPENKADVGSLLRNASQETEITHCDTFLVYHFAEPGNYSGTHIISNIYYHCWLCVHASVGEAVPLPMHRLGYSTSRDHNSNMNEFIWVDTRYNVSYAGNYSLIHAQQITNPVIARFEGNAMYNFTIKDVSGWPRLLTSPQRSSFVILNVEDNTTLQGLDRDNDGLSDYDELYVYYTNPFDPDTDRDDVSDYDEVLGGSDPNNYSDWNHCPDIPTQPEGPQKGIEGVQYPYNTTASDQDGDQIQYGWDWDGNLIVDTWTDFISSGTEVHTTHNWVQYGNYTIRVKAKDIKGAESDWSTPLQVRMYILGDTDPNNQIGFEDINPFILMFINGKNAYYNAYPNGYFYTGDINQDGAVNFVDINPFIQLIINSG